ncbi:glycosyltransferase family 2 protein [Thalassomonas sp. M1454]|uniref:glycosyltransferase family 2 protein n=1 Tax=Thalassomonas sp. M1454 TaxID=2594477 RepID=UPI00117D9B42|nr:glycosyltransferase family 2 protein [Thalassomonas sp. M1454]TRX58156.1 glycosyltransferase [Thalassomonas sp. M1454]
MKVSVLFTTYNSPEWLEKVLWGFSAQSYKNFDIVIADDGSTEETRLLIEKMQEVSGLDISHVWHEDNGFQKCEILNKAILTVKSDYIIFTDGDCIPHPEFVAEHVKNIKPNRFLTGSVMRLPMSTSELISKDDIFSGVCFDWDWLVDNGLPVTRKHLKYKVTGWKARVMNRLTPAPKSFLGCNASAWKQDILDVNGFDQRMQYGGLDRELGVRLRNNGVEAKHVRYNAHVLHLDHPRGYRDPEMMAKNKKLRVFNEKNKVKTTEFGFNLLEP